MKLVVRTRRSIVGVCVLLLAMTGFVPASVLAPTAAKAAVSCADLAITGFTVTPTQPVAGQPASIAISVTNQGTCATQGFVVQFMQSQHATAGPSAPVPGLAVGATTTVNLTYTFPTAGNFLTVAQADPANVIPETNKTNNLAILSVTVVPATIDLTVSNFSISPDEPVQGRPATASITVANLGNTDAGAFRVEWDPRPFVTPVSVQLNSLPAGGSQVVTLTYTYLSTGTFTTKAIVDPTHMVKETDETNNTASMSVTVIPPLPDLIVSSVTTSSNPVAGVPVTATIKVTNQGVAPAGSFFVQWTPGAGIRPLTVLVTSLATGASTTMTLSYSYAKAGTYDSTVTVDPTNRVRELDESNNTDAFQVVVQAPFVDLVAIGLAANPPNPQQGVPTTISFTVQNQGNVASGPFLVAWNPDTTGLIVPSVQTLSSQVNGLAAGASTTVTFSFSYPKFGNFRTIGQIDPFNAVKESNKTNNDLLLYLTVSPGNVDVEITGLSVAATYPGATSGSPIIRASEATATITIKNDGTFPAGNFAVQWRYNSTDPSGPTVSLPGLVPGATQTITINGAFPKAGSVTPSAVVDPFNQLIEPGEPAQPNDPDAVITTPTAITVQPRMSNVDVTVVSYHVLHSLQSGDNHAWFMKSVIPKKGATCDLFSDTKKITIKDVQCSGRHKNDVSDGDTVTLNDTFTNISLVESTPVVAAFGGVAIHESETCFIVCVPTDLGGEFVGVALLLQPYPDYLAASSVVIPGAGGIDTNKNKVCGSPADGHCFDATFSIHVNSAPPPLFKSGAFAATASPTNQTAITATAADITTLPPDIQAAINNYESTLQSLPGKSSLQDGPGVLTWADWQQGM